MKRYDPAKAPDPVAWLELDEGERLELVVAYHRRARHRPPNVDLHAIVHTVVENQAALGDEMPVRRTIRRLMEEGLDRHEAVHAVGSVLAAYFFDALRGGEPEAEFPVDAYIAEVEGLTAAGWLASWEDDEAAP